MKSILIVFAMLLATFVFGEEDSYLSYDDFIRQAESGIIQSATLDKHSSISGTMVDEGVTNTFRSYANTGSANDPLLIRSLKENGVKVSMRDVAKPSHTMPMMTGFMFLFAPVVFLVLMVIIIMKLNRVLENQKNANK